MPHGDVRACYDYFGEREWMRLEDPVDGAVEFAVTCDALAAYLLSGGRVLDLGSGPGRYALWLAGREYRVVLADLSLTLLDIARKKVAEAAHSELIEEIVEADACDLSRWSDGAFDAVLALGRSITFLIRRIGNVPPSNSSACCDLAEWSSWR